MKASEMTNEELAKAIEKRVAEAASNWDFAPTLREAAARLRKIDTYCAINERQDIDNAKLRANLIVAEDALKECRGFAERYETDDDYMQSDICSDIRGAVRTAITTIHK